MTNTTTPGYNHTNGSKNQLRNIFIIGILFFVFGFVTWLGSVLIPYLTIACGLNNVESYLVAFAFYISYFLLAVPSAAVLKKTGYKKGMSLGLLLMAAGTLVFIPAALTRMYFLFLSGLFVQGSGLAILQTAANPYIVVLGPRESAAKRISVMGICNGIAGIIGPLILGAIILKDTDNIKKKLLLLSNNQKVTELNTLAGKVIAPYICMAVVLLLLAVFIFYSGLPEIDTDIEEQTVSKIPDSGKNIFQFPHLIIGAVTLFLYVGVEVIAGDTIINYGLSQRIALSTAKFFSSFTLTAMLMGYLIGIATIPKLISQQKALFLSAVAGIFFALTALATNGLTSVVFIALLGLANSLMWPSIWPLALDGLGRFTKTGSSLLIMAIGGGAILPLLYGRIADSFSPHEAYWMVVPCYAMIFFYAVKGHKIKKWD
jgi:FHS family L-fucose permease-like MFS transporter